MLAYERFLGLRGKDHLEIHLAFPNNNVGPFVGLLRLFPALFPLIFLVEDDKEETGIVVTGLIEQESHVHYLLKLLVYIISLKLHFLSVEIVNQHKVELFFRIEPH